MTSTTPFTSRPGFTLLEFALTIVIFSILLSLSLFASAKAIARTNLRSSENALIQMIRRAQTQSQQNIDGKQWGIYICSEEGRDVTDLTCKIDGSEIRGIVLFGRDAYQKINLDGAGDTFFEINPNITVVGTLHTKMIDNSVTTPGGKGLVFKRFTGDPIESTYNGKVTLTMFGTSRDVTVNERGVVER